MLIVLLFRPKMGLCTKRLLADTKSQVDKEDSCVQYEERQEYPWRVGDKLKEVE